MDVLALRTQVETTLSSVLGTYELANGVTTPAISVRPAGEKIATATKAEGVECVIVRDPEPVELRQYRQQVAFHRWTLFLLDWGGQTALRDVAGLLLWDWPTSDATEVPVPRGVGPKAQLRVQILTPPDFDPEVHAAVSLLLENGARLLLETGDLLLLEA